MTTTLLNLVNTINEEVCSVQLKVATLKGYVEGFYDFQRTAEPAEPVEPAKPSIPEKQIPKNIETEKGIHKFSKKELNSMPEKYLMIFKQNALYAHKRITRQGYVEIRITIEGRYICGIGKDEEIATQRFIAALRRAEAEPVGKNITFGKYVDSWLETVKKPHIKPTTYISYKEDCKALCNAFGNKRVSDIKQLELQKFINGYCEQGKYRTAQRLHVMLSAIFDYAAVDELVRISPMKKIVKPKNHPKHGQALTREEEKAILNGLNGKHATFAKIYAIFLYTGVRRGEFNSMKIIDGWVYVNCEKTRKFDGDKMRRLPVNPMLARVLKNVNLKELQVYANDILTRKIKLFCNERHLHDLRHTFITRCQEYGIKREIVSMWAGHNADSSITTTIYTHLEQNEEIQINEAKKLYYNV